MTPIVLFTISVTIVLGVSFMTPPPDPRQLEGLTFQTLTPAQRAENRSSWGASDVVHTVVVLSAILFVYVYFTG